MAELPNLRMPSECQKLVNLTARGSLKLLLSPPFSFVWDVIVWTYLSNSAINCFGEGSMAVNSFPSMSHLKTRWAGGTQPLPEPRTGLRTSRSRPRPTTRCKPQFPQFSNKDKVTAPPSG